jgi:hypothetical protein
MHSHHTHGKNPHKSNNPKKLPSTRAHGIPARDCIVQLQSLVSLLHSPLHTNSCDVGQVRHIVPAREFQTMFPRSHSSTLSGQGQGSRMYQPWRISKAQTLRCSDRVHGLYRGFDGSTTTKLPSIRSSMQKRKPSDLLPKTFAIHTSNSVHWEVMESFGEVFLLHFFWRLSMIHDLKAPTNLK